jgi:hypothetical protein
MNYFLNLGCFFNVFIFLYFYIFLKLSKDAAQRLARACFRAAPVILLYIYFNLINMSSSLSRVTSHEQSSQYFSDFLPISDLWLESNTHEIVFMFSIGT